MIRYNKILKAYKHYCGNGYSSKMLQKDSKLVCSMCGFIAKKAEVLE